MKTPIPMKVLIAPPDDGWRTVRTWKRLDGITELEQYNERLNARRISLVMRPRARYLDLHITATPGDEIDKIVVRS